MVLTVVLTHFKRFHFEILFNSTLRSVKCFKKFAKSQGIPTKLAYIFLKFQRFESLSHQYVYVVI